MPVAACVLLAGLAMPLASAAVDVPAGDVGGDDVAPDDLSEEEPSSAPAAKAEPKKIPPKRGRRPQRDEPAPALDDIPAFEGAVSRELEWLLLFDLPIAMTATTPVTRTNSKFLPWLGIRGGYLHPVDPVLVGGEVMLALAPEQGGTPDVGVMGMNHGIEGRALLGYPVQSAHFGIIHYGFVGGFWAMNLSWVHVYSSSRLQALPTLAGRAGGGLMVKAGALSIRSDVAAGVRDLGPELSGTLSLGLVF